MAANKSNTRTVLNTTITSVTSYTSSTLDVGDLYELAVDCNVTAHTGGHFINFIVNRIGADGNAYNCGATDPTNTTGPSSTSVGAGLNDSSFGDQIQITLNNLSGDTVSATISILGKG